MLPFNMRLDRIRGRTSIATRNIIGAGIVAIAAVSATSASADWCHDEVISAANKTEVAQILRSLEGAGLQNSDLYRKVKAAFDGQTRNATNQCRDELKVPQDIMDSVVAFGTGGLSLIAPGKMLHVDVGEILDGNILGGKNSFFRKNLGLKF